MNPLCTARVFRRRLMALAMGIMVAGTALPVSAQQATPCALTAPGAAPASLASISSSLDVVAHHGPDGITRRLDFTAVAPPQLTVALYLPKARQSCVALKEVQPGVYQGSYVPATDDTLDPSGSATVRLLGRDGGWSLPFGGLLSKLDVRIARSATSLAAEQRNDKL